MFGPHHLKISSGTIYNCPYPHHSFIGNIAVRKDTFIHAILFDQFSKLIFPYNGNPLGVKFNSCQTNRIFPTVNIRDLSCCKSNDFIIGISSEIAVEIMKISAGCTNDYNSFFCHNFSPCLEFKSSLKDGISKKIWYILNRIWFSVYVTLFKEIFQRKYSQIRLLTDNWGVAVWSWKPIYFLYTFLHIMENGNINILS